MKTLQFIPLLALSALTGGSAFAQIINYTSQSRSVSANAEVFQGLPSSDSATAPDFSEFNASAGATAEGNFGFADAVAGQQSFLMPTGFSFGGAASTIAEGSGVANASSLFSIQFEVSAPTEFSLVGGSEAGGIGLASKRFARMDIGAGPGFSFSGGGFGEFWGLGQGFSLDGLLEPGTTYTFTANLEATAEEFGGNVPFGGIQPARVFTGGSQSFLGGADFSLVSPVPESGTTVAGLAVGGLALWQWRRRRA
jgi:hypothetical protein